MGDINVKITYDLLKAGIKGIHTYHEAVLFISRYLFLPKNMSECSIERIF